MPTRKQKAQTKGKQERQKSSRTHPAAYHYKLAKEMLESKIDSADPEALGTVLKIILLELVILDETQVRFQPVGREEAEEFLDNMIRWLRSVQFGFAKLFSLTRRQIGDMEALDNLGILISLVIDLREGSPNAYADGLKRRRGDRRDNRRLREAKNQAARVYRFLVSIGAMPQEATDTINNTFTKHCEVFGLPKVARFETAALRKRMGGLDDIPSYWKLETLAMLGRPGPPFVGPLPTEDQDERGLLIRATCIYLLSGYITTLAYLGEK